MKVYLAAPYSARDGIRSFASELTAVGMECTSTWLHDEVEIGSGTVGPASNLDDGAVRGHVTTDLRDIRKADVLVVFTEKAASLLMRTTGSSGGRHVETGYAIALNKPVVVVGKPENVFHRGAPSTTVVPDWHEALIELVRRREQMRREQPEAASA